MAEPVPLAEFFKAHGGFTEERFLDKYDGAFLLLRYQGSPPAAFYLERRPDFSVSLGSDDECDLPFEMDQTLDARHATIAYHEGFRGWTIEDHKTEFGTFVGKQRIQQGRAHLIQDREVVKVGGLMVMQLYTSAALWGRMSKAGITKRIKSTPKPPLPDEFDDDDEDEDEELE
ncbi:MAG: FHA domain-containing protein [Planctomycetes bacterium]|nr:FHA domain-containing protein [Planctomycetota bacterium]